MSLQKERHEKVAVVGGGPGGLVAAKYLRANGFEPAIFERSDRLGGQWNARSPHSGVWPSMRTNTSRVLTCFSDLEHEPDIAVYPSNRDVQRYLERYAERFGLTPHVRLRTAVERVSRSGEGWEVRSLSEGGETRTERFSHVVVASGRYTKPSVPDVPGLESFAGDGGVTHTYRYKEPERYRGLRVLVAGCSISALEIASDLAMLGAARVVTTFRRQRYVLQKLLAGVPADHVAFTRFAALAGERFPAEVSAAALKELILRTSGSPEQFGAPAPAEDVFEAGVTQCQHYLALVAEGRIAPRPWMASVDGRTVRFADGSEEEVDAIVFGTGYELELPFLDDEIRRAVEAGTRHLALDRFTFHPDLSGLAFAGLYDQVGPYFPVLELQARWIAYVWSGLVAAPSRGEMAAGVAAARARAATPHENAMHAMALLFARAAGVEPDLREWPDLTRALMFGPLSGASFRLSGPDSLPDAAERVAREAAAFGAVPSSELTPEQRAQLAALDAASAAHG